MGRNGYVFFIKKQKSVGEFEMQFQGEALMRFPIFAKAIHKCDKVLKPHGIDIVDIITNKDKKVFDNILNSFVGIAAIQV